jgi:hypothetical protein
MLVTKEKHEWTAKEAAQITGIKYSTIIRWKEKNKVIWRRDAESGLLYIDRQSLLDKKAKYDVSGYKQRKNSGRPKKDRPRP